MFSVTKSGIRQSQSSISFPLPGLEKIPGMGLDLSSLSELPEADIREGASTARGANADVQSRQPGRDQT